MKKVIKIVLFILFGVIAGILLTEGLLRIMSAMRIIEIAKFDMLVNDPWIYSRTLAYRPKPNLSVPCNIENNDNIKGKCIVNKYGIRDKDYPFEKSENTYRVMIMGDSMTYGLGVNNDQSYPEYLEKMLQTKKTNKAVDYEVLNMGMTFYGPAQYYNLYKELGQQYKPDLIIAGVHLLTDPWESYVYEENAKHFYYKALPDKLIPLAINDFLKKNMYTWRVVLGGYYGWANRLNIDLVKREMGSDKRFQYETQLHVSSPYMQKAWGISERYLQLLVKDAGANGTRTIVVGIPSRAQVVSDEWLKIKQRGLVSDRKLYEDSQSKKKLLLLCKENKWMCFDLQEDLRKSENPSKLFIGEDFHFSPEGNSAVADVLYNYLIANKIVKE